MPASNREKWGGGAGLAPRCYQRQAAKFPPRGGDDDNIRDSVLDPLFLSNEYQDVAVIREAVGVIIVLEAWVFLGHQKNLLG